MLHLGLKKKSGWVVTYTPKIKKIKYWLQIGYPDNSFFNQSLFYFPLKKEEISTLFDAMYSLGIHFAPVGIQVQNILTDFHFLSNVSV